MSKPEPEDENLMTDHFKRVDYIEDRPIKDWREVKATEESEDEPDYDEPKDAEDAEDDNEEPEFDPDYRPDNEPPDEE